MTEQEMSSMLETEFPGYTFAFTDGGENYDTIKIVGCNCNVAFCKWSLIPIGDEEKKAAVKKLVTNIIKYNNTTYIFDVDGDDKWDLIYDTTKGVKKDFYDYIEPKLTPGFEIYYLLMLIAMFMLIIRRKKR